MSTLVELLPLGEKLTTLEYARRSRGLTQAELERLAGLSAGTVVHYEKRARRPSAWTRLRLARALDLDQEILFPDAEPVEPPA